MSTKGLVGYRQHNQDYLSLRTSDAYLENGVGTDVIKLLKNYLHNEYPLNLLEIFLFNNDNKIPSDTQATYLADSLFMEYAYIVNFDTQQLEFYVGGNQSGILDNEKLGRYHQLTFNYPAHTGIIPYQGIVLVTTMSFNQIKQLEMKDIIRKVASKYNQRKKYLTIANKKAIIDCKDLNTQEMFDFIIKSAINTNLCDVTFNTEDNQSNNTIAVKFANRKTKRIKYLVNSKTNSVGLLGLVMGLGYQFSSKGLSDFSIAFNSNDKKYYIRCQIITLDNNESQVSLRILNID